MTSQLQPLQGQEEETNEQYGIQNTITSSKSLSMTKIWSIIINTMTCKLVHVFLFFLCLASETLLVGLCILA